MNLALMLMLTLAYMLMLIFCYPDVDADLHHGWFSLQVKTELHDIHPPSVLKSHPHLRDPSKLNARLEAGQCARAEFALRQCAAWSAFIYLAQG